MDPLRFPSPSPTLNVLLPCCPCVPPEESIQAAHSPPYLSGWISLTTSELWTPRGKGLSLNKLFVQELAAFLQLCGFSVCCFVFFPFLNNSAMCRHQTKYYGYKQYNRMNLTDAGQWERKKQQAITMLCDKLEEQKAWVLGKMKGSITQGAREGLWEID